ncbi:phytoene/squalene synthase family protein [candidate division KSB1 bacterium]|nr:phytoene/squalene synthase family protein [candidate division KSB1 bacterium]
MKTDLMKSNPSAFRYARHITAKYSKSFYISTRLLPKQKQWATFALYGFCRYADNLIDNPRSRSHSEILHEVEFLERELEIGYRTGESEHPILSSFISVATEYGIPFEYPKELLKGVVMDIQKSRYNTFDELYTFCYRVAGVVGIMMTYVLGYTNDKAFKYAEKLGIAMQLTNILRDIQEDKEMNRIYIPLDEMARFNIKENDFLKENLSSKFIELMKFQVIRAHKYYDEAQSGIKMLATDSRFAIYSASTIYRGILRKIEERTYNPFLGRVYVPIYKKLIILFKEVLHTKFEIAQERLNILS